MPSRSRLFVHMAKNHASIAQRIEKERGDTGVDWKAMLSEWRAQGIVNSGFTRNAAQKVWERVCRSEAWKRYQQAGSGVRVVEHAPVSLNPPEPQHEPEASDEDAVTRMLIQRRGEY